MWLVQLNWHLMGVLNLFLAWRPNATSRPVTYPTRICICSAYLTPSVDEHGLLLILGLSIPSGDPKNMEDPQDPLVCASPVARPSRGLKIWCAIYLGI